MDKREVRRVVGKVNGETRTVVPISDHDACVAALESQRAVQESALANLRNDFRELQGYFASAEDVISTLNSAQRSDFATIKALRAELAAVRAELAEARKPPPCKHERQRGWGDTSGDGEMWCELCGKQMKFKRAATSAAPAASATTIAPSGESGNEA